MTIWTRFRRYLGIRKREITPLGPVNYIPLSAIRASRKARIEADIEKTDDKYSQEKVSANAPSDKEAILPDDQVMPG